MNLDQQLPDYRNDPQAYEVEERARPDEMKMGVALLGRRQNCKKQGFFANLSTSHKLICRRYGF